VRIPDAVKILGIILATYITGFFFVDLVAGGEDFLVSQMQIAAYGWWLLALVLVAKILITTLAYSMGFPGGFFLPLLVIGGLFGKLFAIPCIALGWVLPQHVPFFMMLGMACMFIVVVRTPTTGIILILEMTQKFTLLPYLVAAGAISYFFSQVLKSRPIYSILYQHLSESLDPGPEDAQVLSVRVNTGSYFANLSRARMELPSYARLVSLERAGQPLPIDSDFTILADDILSFNVPDALIEPAFPVLRAMAGE
jgi:hypothetical protein